MKLSAVLLIIMMTMGGVGYWYYTDTQKTIAILTENNAKLEMAVATNEEALKSMQQDYAAIAEENKKINAAYAEIRRQNNRLSEKLADMDLGLLAAEKPESIESAVNRGTVNAGRCFELLSGAELTEIEKNAKDDVTFNKECPWLYDDYKSRGMLTSSTTD